MKHFILTSIILILLWVIQFVYFHFGNHNWSKVGYKENDIKRIVYDIYIRLYLIGWGIFLIIKYFVPWYVEL